MKKSIFSLLASLTLGFIIGTIYYVFTHSVSYFIDLLWFDIFDINNNKLSIVVLSIFGGFFLSGLTYFFKKHKINVDNFEISDLSKIKKPRASWLFASIILGFASLVAGASLGPEAILMPISFAVGMFLANIYKINNSKIFGLLAIVALLGAFFNSWYAGLIPLSLIVISKKLQFKESVTLVALGLFAVIGSLASLNILGDNTGYVALEAFSKFSITPKLLILAFIFSASVTLIPLLVKKLSHKINIYFDKIPKKWYLHGLIGGLILGILYYLIGPVAMFSGSEGMPLLIKDNSQYTSLQLVGIAIGKILVTAWCVGTIYRGGIVFPLLFSGVSIALLLSGGIPDTGWLVTLLVATFFGIFYGSFGSLAIALAFVLSVFGLSVWPLLISAFIGSWLVKKIYKKPITKKIFS